MRSHAPVRSRPLVAMLISVVLTWTFSATGVAAADPSDPPPGVSGEALVEVNLADRAALDQLVASGADLAEYLRQNDDGTLTVNVFATQDELDALAAAGYDLGAVIQDDQTYLDRRAEIDATRAAEAAAADLALADAGAEAPSGIGTLAVGELAVQRVDYFQNYAGRFLSVEVRNSLGTATGGPSLALSWDSGPGTPIDNGPENMNKFVDTDPTPDTYMYHRELVRIGAAGSSTPLRPDKVRIASSTGETVVASVNTWLGGGLPPHADGYMKGFFTHYMDTVEVNAHIADLVATYPDLAEIIDLPNQTNGYQRKAMANMNGTGGIGSSPQGGTAQSQTVVLTSLAFGHEGGNAIRAAFVNPGVADQPLSVAVSGSDITVSLATNSGGALTSTAAQVSAAINASPAASALVSATPYRTNAGAGIVQPRAQVNLSDFLNAPAAYPRGPQTEKMIRIGKHRDGSKVGVFLYCNQHAREWTTPLVCLETASRLLVNYAIDPVTRDLVDNLDIFIIPTSNPDGLLSSLYDFNSQRKNMKSYCGQANSAANDRNGWGVDLNRNNTVGTLFDGYGGASTNCTSELFAGPFEMSEPEIKNEHWVVDTFTNIKFANNIHSYGGYFMWAPGSYIYAGRVTLPAPNIGVEGYFFAAGDTILNRIKEDRNTVILPQRTGPIADVLYSAAGNSADDQWYRRGIIAYSFETGADIFVSSTSGTSQQAVGFFPNYATEGQYEGLEFASGNFGLLEEALEYARDVTAPQATTVLCTTAGDEQTCSPSTFAASQTPLDVTFRWINEPSVIYYTLDGSTPTTASQTWEAQGPRQPGIHLTITEPTTIKWLAVDIKGNTSAVGSAFFAVETNPPTIDIVQPAAGMPGYALGSTHAADYSCDDDAAGVASCVGTVPDGSPFDTSSVGFHAFTVNAADLAGNTASANVQYNVYWNQNTGFLQPIDLNAINVVKAGASVPVKFSLGADYGLGIIAAGYPQSRPVTCDASDPLDPIEETASPGGSTLSYDPATNRYTYVWKTQKNWAGTCREFSLKLIDNTVHVATFKFTK